MRGKTLCSLVIRSCGCLLLAGVALVGNTDFYTDSSDVVPNSFDFYDADQKLDAKVNKLLNEAHTCDMYALTCTNSGDTGLAAAYRRLSRAALKLADAYNQGYTDAVEETRSAYNRARSMLNAAIAQRQ